MQRAQKILKRLEEHFSKQRDEVFADSIEKTSKKPLAHLGTDNQKNCNKKLCAMFSLFTEFITEFESTWVIILKQLFAEGKGKINE